MCIRVTLFTVFLFTGFMLFLKRRDLKSWREPSGADGSLRQEKTGEAELVKDPWRVRDNYIKVVLNRSIENIKSFFSEYAIRELSREETSTAGLDST